MVKRMTQDKVTAEEALAALRAARQRMLDMGEREHDFCGCGFCTVTAAIDRWEKYEKIVQQEHKF